MQLLDVFTVLGLIVPLAIAAGTDLHARTIPNTVPVTILISIVIGCLAFPELQEISVSRIIALAIMIVAGTLLGVFRIMGGGDIKLLAAIAPWHGLAGLPSVLLLIGIAGGLLGGIYAARSAFAGEGWRQGLKSRIPYGVAILAGETVWFALNLLRA